MAHSVNISAVLVLFGFLEDPDELALQILI